MQHKHGFVSQFYTLGLSVNIWPGSLINIPLHFGVCINSLNLAVKLDIFISPPLLCLGFFRSFYPFPHIQMSAIFYLLFFHSPPPSSSSYRPSCLCFFFLPVIIFFHSQCWKNKRCRWHDSNMGFFSVQSLYFLKSVFPL